MLSKTVLFAYLVTTLISQTYCFITDTPPLQQILSQDGKPNYPTDLTYTNYHVWFRRDNLETSVFFVLKGLSPLLRALTSINLLPVTFGVTSWPISNILDGEVRAANWWFTPGFPVLPMDRMAELMGPNGDEGVTFTVRNPFAAEYLGRNQDFGLVDIVEDPYGPNGFIGSLEGQVPPTEPLGVRFMNSTEYERFVNGLK